MRLVFMGTPDFAVPALDSLLAAGHEIAAVYSQPPRPAGRGKELKHSPVHQRAEAAGLDVRTPHSLRDAEAQAAFAELHPDAAVVAAYGLILPQPILDAPALGCLNIHASLLPRWRGAAPIQRAILAGDVRTGVTIMQMESGLDTGPMLAARETDVDRKTAGSLTAELADLGGVLMAEVLEHLPELRAQPQPEQGITYAAKIRKDEARLDFSQTAICVERQVRAFNPAPGAFFEYGGERIKVLAAEPADRSGPAGTVLGDDLAIACGEGAILPTLVQRSGRGAMSAEALLRGFAIPTGAKLA
ncbi:methionyl-tRNA formyltransferase [Sphingosinicella rhizophila]|uniref:Methionyl-tRNA formyltransferase n=1 Tax=Sphingosinicella rhizophila TaxID=3050082 RepID=A0ABU3Q2W5_9SPHN|nr:methionyl-tRNA formyltransferase [Sphingosinicella sp. GR2756]MDT9597750.1 methionyl-tRNA formyltransferase [Sphingosinicella sp. GR2756]